MNGEDKMDRTESPRQILSPSPTGLCCLGIYVNSASGNLFYASSIGNDGAENRIKPDRVWLDKDGFICVQVERRKDV